MARFRSVYTTKDKLEQLPIEPGKMIFCSDTGEMFIDTLESTRVQVSGAKGSKNYNITLPANGWTYDGTDYVQTPDYSTEIFGGKMYDEAIDVIVSVSPESNNPSPIMARPNSDSTRVEFVTDITPTEDVVMILTIKA